MGRYADFILDFLAQFAGGRGGAENELARFGLAGGFWAILLIVTLGRLREEERPHERWLAYGFALGLLRETFMFIVEGLDILGVVSKDSMHPFFPPLEHALSMAAVIVVAGAFLRYLLEDEVLARRYIKIGLAVTAFDYLATFWWWYLFITANPSFKFGQTWADWLFRVTASVLFAYPLLLFYKRRIPGWVRTTVLVAFSFFFLCEFLMLFNLASGEVYKEIYNPIRHSLHILAIPLLGNVYYLEAKERSKRARKELRESRDFIKSVFDSVHDAISVI
ncbi:MAG: GGDEF domain-containing protein, partial [Methanobacteriota archaeon]